MEKREIRRLSPVFQFTPHIQIRNKYQKGEGGEEVRKQLINSI